MASNDRQSIGTNGIDRRTLLNGAAVVGGAALAAGVLAGTAQAQLPENGEVVRVSLIIDESEVASFGELTGLVSEIEPNEYLSSGSPINLKRVKPPSAVLKRGLTQSAVLWTWHAQVLSGDPAARKSGSLIGYNAAGEPVVRYSLVNAWPAKVQLTSPASDGSPGAIETVILIMDRVERVNP